MCGRPHRCLGPYPSPEVDNRHFFPDAGSAPGSDSATADQVAVSEGRPLPPQLALHSLSGLAPGGLDAAEASVVKSVLRDDDERLGVDLPGASEPMRAAVATFAPDGSQRCSGLPVARYSAGDLAVLLGERWAAVVDDLEQHVAPAGAVQPFVWMVFRRIA